MDTSEISLAALSAEQRRAVYLLLQKRGVDVLAHMPIERADRTLAHPLSGAQRRLYMLWQLDRDSSAYNIAGALRLRGPFDAGVAEAVLQAIVQRHEALRTTFREQRGVPEQVVHAELPVALRVATVVGTSDEARELHVRDDVRDEIRAPFDLTVGPLLRARLFALGSDHAVFVLTLHHIVADAWSLQLVIEEFGARYQAKLAGRELVLAEPAIQYLDYACFQRSWLEAGERERQLTVAREQLADRDDVPLRLPSDRARPAVQSSRGKTLRWTLAPELARGVKRLAQQAGSTPFVVLLGVFEALLYRYTGQTDLTVGVPVANRERSETHGVVGFFVNTQVLRTRLSGRAPFVELLASLKQASLEAHKTRELPFDELVDALRPARSLSHNPLFQVMFSHLKRRDQPLAKLSGLSIEPLVVEGGTTQFDLTLDSQEDEHGTLALSFEYAADLLSETTVARMRDSLGALLAAFVRDPRTSIGDVALVSSADRSEHKSARRGELYELVHDRVRRWAVERPTFPALVCGEHTLSHSDLDARVERLAAVLSAHGAGRDVIVAVAAARSLDTVVALLAVLRAGAAFLPLDLSYPPARLAMMVEDAGVGLLVAPTRTELPACLSTLVRIAVDGEGVARGPLHVRRAHPEQLAYVLFTSGSTGRPKAVSVSHGALALHASAMVGRYELGSQERFLQFSSFAFDASLDQWLVPLIAGVTVVVRPDLLWSAAECAEVIERERITRVDLPPAYARELAAYVEKRGRPLPLCAITVGGEALSREALAVLGRAFGGATLFNAYGPTEAVVTPLLWRAEGAVDGPYAPIGRPVGARSAQVLDAERNFVPDGVVGELFLGGEGLSRGYLGRAAATAERFVPDPSGAPGSRRYRTGDLARVRGDGTLEYLGRSDGQVKLRGHRIELGELEAQLSQQPLVREAFAHVSHDGDHAQLLAYVGAEEGARAEELSHALALALPAYMLPAQVVVLPSLPRTPNGKVDVRALPLLSELERAPSSAAEGALEALLASLFSELLGVADVGRDDNFFRLGGDSIVSLQLVSRARERGVSLTPRDVFQHQTVRELARAVSWLAEEREDQEQVDALLDGVALPLTPIQHDFFANVPSARDHYNQSVLLRRDSALDPLALSEALRALVVHHDALRLRFEEHGGELAQRYASVEDARAEAFLWVRDCADEGELLHAAEHAQRSLSLRRGPVLRALYARMGDGSSRLLWVVHHLVVDGVSWRVLLEDLAAAYQARVRGETPRFPRKTSSYGAWSNALALYASGPQLVAEQEYWAERLAVGTPALAPRREATAMVRAVKRVETRLDREHTSLLLREAQGAYRTQGSELLLAALARAVHSVTKAESIAVEVEGHGREDRFEGVDVSRTVGWFTALYALCLVASDDLAATIVHTKEEARGARTHALSYGVLKDLAGGLPDGATRPWLTFNYLGQFDAALPADGAAWTLASEPRGDEQDAATPLGNALEINGQVFGGELTLTFSYASGSYDDLFVPRLARAYEEALRAVAEHCRQGVLLAATPSDFPLCALTQDELAALPIAARDIEDIYPLTPMQQGLLFHSIDAPEAGTYVNQLDVEVRGLDAERLARAWQRVVDRHAILRTAFVWQGVTQSVQVVHRAVEAAVAHVDLRAASDLTDALETLRERDHARGFELSVAPLLRLTIATLPDQRHHLLWTSHHLLLDGWSNARVIGELLAAYAGTLPSAEPPSFRSYLEWLEARPVEVAERFWRARLSNLDEPTYLASSVAPRAREAGRGLLRRELDPEASGRLRAFVQAERITLNTLVEGAWALLLGTYCGKSWVSFGTATSGRPTSLAGSGEMLGLFINTLPSVQRVSGVRSSVGDFLRALQHDAVAAREHEHTPLYTLQRWAGQPGRALFDTLLVFENYPTDAALAQAGAGLSFGKSRGRESTNYPLAVSVNAGASLSFAFEFARADFDDALIDDLAARLVHLLGELAARPEAKLAAVELLCPRDACRLAQRHVEPRRHARDVFVHALIAQRARIAPHACALSCEDASLTFAELDVRANQLAQRLVQLGVRSEQRIGLGLDRSPELIVALLAVLKAGGAYVPLDPSYPSERLAFMATDARLSLVITRETLRARFRELDVPVVLIEDSTLLNERVEPPHVVLAPDNAAYIIYTSGSTGRPKGVTVSHGALAMHCQAAAELYALSERDTALHMASISFDAAVEQWAVPLLSGARLVLSSDQLSGAEALLSLVEREQVSLIYPPTSQLLQLAALLVDQRRTLHVRLLCVGGEAVSRDTIARLRESFTPERIINGYGPTEAVITPLLWQAHADTACGTAYAPIGTVVGERSSAVLDSDLRPVPPGVVGELYIGGIGLARGYHARAGLTASRFLPLAGGGRMYRTGDLVRALDTGALEFVGRVDQQIKLRGFRIEPGEIEDVLAALPSVREAVVSVQLTPVKRLIGYVASVPNQQAPTEAQLLLALRSKLPEHMVPARIVLLDSLPRTPNGKVDRARLPTPEQRARGFVAPIGELEQRLAALFVEVLGVPEVSRDDNFFELGGDSIVSIQLVSRARKHGLAITPRQIFQEQTLAAIARVVSPLSVLAKATRAAQGEVALTPIQATFFASSVPARHHFNQALLLAPRVPLDPEALSSALAQVVRHHDALRLRYSEAGGRITQRYVPLAECDLDAVLWRREAHSREAVEALCQEAQRSLDLTHGPLLRALHIRFDDGSEPASERLLLVVHHLVVDGVSFRILLEDLDLAYRAAEGGGAAELVRTSSFAAWSDELLRFARTDAELELRYWERALAQPNLPLPRDVREEPAGVERASVHVRFDRTFSQRLLRETGKAYGTRIDELLLTALSRALCAFSAQSSVLIELEGHGREDLGSDVDTSRTLGWFTTSFPVRLSGVGALPAAIVSTKEQLRSVPRRGLSFGVLAQLASETVRERVRVLPRPQVSFNYLGQFDQSFDAERSLFAPARESSGDDTDPSAPLQHDFAVGGEIYRGQLALSFTYAPARHRRATVQDLTARFRKELEALVEHCTSQEQTVLTPSDVPLAALDEDALRRALSGAPSVYDVYRLTPMQEGMLFHALADAGEDVYVTQLVADAHGLDVERFRAAFQATVDAHESLRTSFVHRGLPHPVQRVHSEITLPFSVLGAAEVAGSVDELAERDRREGLVLDQAPLMRVTLVQKAGGHRLIWTSHHLLLDGWSSSLLFGEVLQRYHGGQVSPPRARFRDYVAWLSRQDREASARFYRPRLAALAQPTLLAGPGADHRAHGHASLSTRVAPAAQRVLEQFVLAEHVTVNTVVQGALVVLLSRLTGQRTVAFGSTVSGRPAALPDVEQLLGLFINTLPVIAGADGATRVGPWLRALQADNVELREHEHTPLYELQSWSGAAGPLFDTLLVFENYPVSEALGAQRGALSFRAASTHETTNYPLTIGVSQGETLELSFDYQTDRLHADEVRRIADSLVQLVSQLAESADRQVGALTLTSRASRPGLSSIAVAREPLAVHLQVAVRARESPSRLAVVGEREQLTYAELARRSLAIAGALRRQAVGTESLVGVAVERGPDALATLLGVLHVGAAFVVLDTSYPAAYLEALCTRADLKLVVGPRALRSRFGAHAELRYLALDELADSASTSHSMAMPPPDALAYVLYTSGSTGVPKGVEVTA
ncbi:MAG: hypothetical protein RLZZ450_1371, partial [Pseudomonadota bacterium]